MLPIIFTDLPDDPRLIGSITRNFQNMLINLFHDFFQEYEARYRKSYEDALEDKHFFKFLTSELRSYSPLPRDTVTESFLCAYSMIISESIFNIHNYPLSSDLLLRLLLRANTFRFNPLASIKGPVICVWDSHKSLHTIGHKIGPQEDRDHVRKIYQQFLNEKHDEPVYLLREFFEVIESIEYLPDILGLSDESAEEIVLQYEVSDPDDDLVLPGRWWDPRDDFADYNPHALIVVE